MTDQITRYRRDMAAIRKILPKNIYRPNERRLITVYLEHNAVLVGRQIKEPANRQ